MWRYAQPLASGWSKIAGWDLHPLRNAAFDGARHQRTFRTRKNGDPKAAAILNLPCQLLTLSGTRHAYLVRGLELVKPMDLRCEALCIDLQLELPVVIQGDIPGITARTVTSERKLTIGKHYGTDRCIAILQQYLARDVDPFAGRVGENARFREKTIFGRRCCHSSCHL